MKKALEEIKSLAVSALESAPDVKTVEEIRVMYLGKKGKLTAILKQMGALNASERPIIGQIANRIRGDIESLISDKTKRLRNNALADRLLSEKLDVTMPAVKRSIGKRHPINTVLDEAKEIFLGMGFSVAEGPEVELDYYCFEALNMPKTHPARDTQDTFYISDDVILRTQTSSVQVRVMENTTPPIRIISPGRIYRTDEIDATHSPLFHQIEGLVVDKGITMSNLKGILETFVKRIYGEDAKVRFRPHHFPYTEPSAEMDFSCFACGGKDSGCRICRGEGWVELLGCGMVHPRVLANCGIDPETYSGFAFGMGLDRLTMLRFGIEDLRLLFENDTRFLEQF